MRLYKDDVEVPYQIVGDKMLVRLDGGLAGNGTASWRVEKDESYSASSLVSVTDGGTYWQIDNTLIAVRVPKSFTVSPPNTLIDDSPDPPEQWMRLDAPTQVLAPIQGIRHLDGTWTGTGPNYLYSGQTYEHWTMGNANFPASSAWVEVVENGPLRAKIRLTYAAVRPGFLVGGDWNNPLSIYASTNGYYICTITVEAGQQVIIVDQETDGRPCWSVNMNNGVSADRGRFRSHGGLGMVALQGHNYDGTAYDTQDSRADMDAECDLNYSYRLGQYGENGDGYDWAGIAFDGVTYAPLALWYDWTRDQGCFWYEYNSAGGDNSNMWGIFEGRASLVLGGTMPFGVGAYSKPQVAPRTEHGFATYPQTRAGENHTASPRRFSFGIYLGSKSADVPTNFSTTIIDITGVGRWGPNPGADLAYNMHSGTASLWKQMDQGLDFPDPVGGYPGMYLSRTDTEALIAEIESDQGPGSLFEKLYNEDAGYRSIWDAFANFGGQEYYANLLVDYIFDMISYGVNNYVNWGNIHSIWWAYWAGGLKTQTIATDCNAALSLDQYRPFLTDEQRRNIKTALSMCGHILWDNDFVPLDNPESFGLGTSNMPVQYLQARNQIAIILKDHPQFIARFDGVLDTVTNDFTNATNSYGAPRDCPHYSATMMIPTTDVFRQLQVVGYTDVFATGSDLHARLSGLGEWYMQVLTPPQSRFGGLRKMVTYGDGAAEGHDSFLSLIMGLEAYDLTLCKRMAGAWESMGQPMSSFYSSSGMKIRPNFPTQDPALDDADFPGSFTVMRSGWDTANESAVFLLHGADNVDHSTFQRGSPSIFLLGAPVCVSFGAMYSMDPKVDGPWTGCSTYIPVLEIEGATWDTAYYYTECGTHSAYFDDTYVFNPTTDRADLTCTFDVSGWVRHLTYYRDVLSCPVVRLRDSDTASGESVFTLHMMAEGAVTKPDGSTVTPTTFNDTPFAIANGACFKFTGQWGVSWDVYYFGPSAEAFIGFFMHTWAPGAEQGQYLEATGHTFEERQYILRIKTAGPCDVVIVPYLTGQRPTGLSVTETGGGNLVLNPGARALAN